MNRQERRILRNNADETIKSLDADLKYLQTVKKNQDEVIKRQAADLEEGRKLVAQLTQQLEDSGRAYMHTLGAIAKTNGGEIRIPCSMIDSVNSDDVLENRLDELNDCIVFTIRGKHADAPSGIIIPGRDRR